MASLYALSAIIILLSGIKSKENWKHSEPLSTKFTAKGV